jgi:hypothetical protein
MHYANMSDIFHNQIGLKQGNVLSLLLFHCALKQVAQTHSPLVNFSRSFHIFILLGLPGSANESTIILQTLGNTNPPSWCHIPQDFHL